jgi:hypothetical protein
VFWRRIRRRRSRRELKLIWIHTSDGKRNDTKSLAYEEAMKALEDPNGVLDVEVDEGYGVYRTAIPVRKIVKVEQS